MSVDVLAVLDRIASFHHPIDRIEVLKARAAIAELIAAAWTLKVQSDGRGYFDSGQDCQRFRAALAAVKGNNNEALAPSNPNT